MALEDIFRALEEQADRDVEATLAEARAHAEAIREEAAREAAEVRDNKIAEAERAARSRSSQSLNSVRLEARKTLAAVKERAVHDVFDRVLEEFGNVRSRSDYPQIFRSLVAEALEGVDGEFELLVDPVDEQLAHEVLREHGLSAQVKTEINTAGGVVVVTENGRVMRRNTLEARLDKLRGLAQAEVAEILFA